jgi:hypothetical protein
VVTTKRFRGCNINGGNKKCTELYMKRSYDRMILRNNELTPSGEVIFRGENGF